MRTVKLLASAALALILAASCNVERGLDGTKVNGTRVHLKASAADASTKSYFLADEAPSKHIYWEEDDMFEFTDFTLKEGKIDDGGFKAQITPSALSSDGRVAEFDYEASDFVVVTYPQDAVTLILDESGKLDAAVEVFDEQVLSSTLTPENVPMASKPVAISEAARQAVAAGSVDAVTAEDGAIQLYPLAGIVRMKVVGLPEVSEAKILAAKIGVTVSGTAGKAQVGIKGYNEFALTGDIEQVSTYDKADAYQRHTIFLSAEAAEVDAEGEVISYKSIPYTAENGAEICFVTNHSSEPLTWIYVTLASEDGKVYYKQFNLSSNKISVSKSKISSFTLDFSNGTQVIDADQEYGLEWSEGYIVAGESGYEIGDPDDIGLYFRFGSPEGVKVYDNESYAKAYETGVVRLYSDFSMQLQDKFEPLELYYPDGDAIKSKTLTTPEEVYTLKWSESFSGETDPCSYIAVGAGESKWRVPTLSEVQELIEFSKVTVQYYNIDGSEMIDGNKTPAGLSISTPNDTYDFRVTNFLQYNTGVYNSAVYNQLNMGNYWSNIYFWTSTLNEKYTSAGATGATQSAYAFSKTGISGAVNPFNNFPTTVTSNMDVNRTVKGASNVKSASLQVRCVREAKAGAPSAKTAMSKFDVTDYGQYE